jgi:hypothetical protein
MTNCQAYTNPIINFICEAKLLITEDEKFFVLSILLLFVVISFRFSFIADFLNWLFGKLVNKITGRENPRHNDGGRPTLSKEIADLIKTINEIEADIKELKHTLSHLKFDRDHEKITEMGISLRNLEEKLMKYHELVSNLYTEVKYIKYILEKMID